MTQSMKRSRRARSGLLIGAVAALGLLMGPAIAQDEAGGSSQPAATPQQDDSSGWFTRPHDTPPPEPTPSDSGTPPMAEVVRQCEAQIQAALDQCRTMMDEACRILEERARNCQNGY
jgi:hypothetical protein